MLSRIEHLRTTLESLELDALLVTNPFNRRYLSGFTGTAGWLFISRDIAVIATDFRYWSQAESQAPGFNVYKQNGSFSDWFPGFIGVTGKSKVGFESTDVSMTTHKEMHQIIADIPSEQRPTLVGTESIVEDIRSVKDSNELTELENAVQLGDEAFTYVAGIIEPGWSEKQVAWEIEKYAREHGAEGMSFPTIVGGGSWGAMPHCFPREELISEGQPIVIDMGVVVSGYCSDMTRTIILGEADDQFRRIYDIVLAAQELAEATIESGMRASEAHQIAEGVIKKAGYGENFGHGLGHGVGLEIHEHPRIGRKSDDLLLDGMVITVEPGIYIKDWGGIRIEDMGVMDNGHFRNFTTAPKLRMIGA